jgi:hypothetical protein
MFYASFATARSGICITSTAPTSRPAPSRGCFVPAASTFSTFADEYDEQYIVIEGEPSPAPTHSGLISKTISPP